MLEEEYEAKDILAAIDSCTDDVQLVHLSHRLIARRDQAGWIKQKIEAILYADETTDTKRDQGKKAD